MNELDKEMTPWYPPEIKPVMIGVYEILYDGFGDYRVFSRWDGYNWHWYMGTVEAAHEERGVSCTQQKTWRGLKHAPGR